MIKKRIIPCLDVKEGRVVKGINFVGLRDVGDPVELAKRYNQEGADELVFLDISKTQDGHDLMIDVIRDTAKELFIPLTIGGGISSVEDIRQLLNAGADKVSINSAAIKNPDLIKAASDVFGSQCICVAIDVRFDPEENEYYVYTHGGTKQTDIRAFDWVAQCAALGAGELLITSMNHDGVKEGFDIKFLKRANEMVNIPIIASGGAGSAEHFTELFRETDVSAGLAASIFHNKEVEIKDLKEELSDAGFEVRMDIQPDQPDFEKGNGLLSVILQDYKTRQVLMNGFMNEAAYQKTIEDKVVWFYSRSKERLWKKGETSGNTQVVKSMALDCDSDALLIQVEPKGPTCHLGTQSCFGDDYFNLQILEKIVDQKIEQPQEGSYTKYLTDEGTDKILKKCGEEMTEVIIAAKNDDTEELIDETSDLLYHLLVLLKQQGVSLKDVENKLAERHGADLSYKVRGEIEEW